METNPAYRPIEVSFPFLDVTLDNESIGRIRFDSIASYHRNNDERIHVTLTGYPMIVKIKDQLADFESRLNDCFNHCDYLNSETDNAAPTSGPGPDVELEKHLTEAREKNDADTRTAASNRKQNK